MVVQESNLGASKFRTRPESSHHLLPTALKPTSNNPKMPKLQHPCIYAELTWTRCSLSSNLHSMIPLSHRSAHPMLLVMVNGDNLEMQLESRPNQSRYPLHLLVVTLLMPTLFISCGNHSQTILPVEVKTKPEDLRSSTTLCSIKTPLRLLRPPEPHISMTLTSVFKLRRPSQSLLATSMEQALNLICPSPSRLEQFQASQPRLDQATLTLLSLILQKFCGMLLQPQMVSPNTTWRFSTRTTTSTRLLLTGLRTMLL